MYSVLILIRLYCVPEQGIVKVEDARDVCKNSEVSLYLTYLFSRWAVSLWIPMETRRDDKIEFIDFLIKSINCTLNCNEYS